jgi:uncharacterized membrane protein
MHKKKILAAIFIGVVLVATTLIVFRNPINETVGLWLLHYSDPAGNLVLGRAISVSNKNIILNEEEQDQYSSESVQVSVLNGPDKGKEIAATDYAVIGENPDVGIAPGEMLLLLPPAPYQILDIYRLPALLLVILFFIVGVIWLGGRRGLFSLFGLGASLFVLAGFFAPQLLHGANPLVIGLAGSIAIVLISQYLAHGFDRVTSIAVIGTIITLFLSVAISVLFIQMANIVGLLSQDAVSLKIVYGAVNFQNLLLVGIIIGMLGILDDTTIGQSVGVNEISRANPSLEFIELYKRGMVIGRQHIASLVNTLALAYAGAFLPFFLIIVANVNSLYSPGLLSINSEFIAEEIVRTIAGGFALILAVPITTALAAYLRTRK